MLQCLLFGKACSKYLNCYAIQTPMFMPPNQAFMLCCNLIVSHESDEDTVMPN